MKKWASKMMGTLLGLVLTKENFQLLYKLFLPIIARQIESRLDRPARERFPTVEELKADFEQNVDVYAAEGKAWLDAHPEP